MGKFGKWLGGGLGFVIGGPIGGLLGFLFGSAVDDSGQLLEPYYRNSPDSDSPG